MSFDVRNQQYWADRLVDELVRCGVTHFCIAPGSRSTPLVAAVARHPEARAIVHYDERGTAFLALGYGRATGRPAAWITTSGTAVANGFPAVVEASQDEIPLLLLTADRPPELRDTGANQTIDQVKLFGGYVRWHFELPVPDPDLDVALVQTTVAQAVYRSVRPPAGPVHLNCPFREPLIPAPDALSPLEATGAPRTRYVAPVMAPDPQAVAELAAMLRSVARGLIVAGRLRTAEAAAAVEKLAAHLGWPLLPDVTSGLRLGEGAFPRVPFAELLLAEPERAARMLQPEVVLHVGGRFVSKRLLQFVQAARLRAYVHVHDSPIRLDPAHRVTLRLEADVARTCAALREALPGATEPSPWARRWQQADRAVQQRLQQQFQTEELAEPDVAWHLARWMPSTHGLVLASSLPVRLVHAWAAPDGARPPVAANRGASGIDGTVATAAGFALGLARPVTLLIGDLALLHDLNSLALLRERPVVVVALNNDGGGIFSFLPIARHAEVFEPFFGTPHGLQFAHAARLFGLNYEAPRTLTELAQAYRAACARPSATLIEVRTERARTHARWQELEAALADLREAFYEPLSS
ncbi:2-succinyl-5-enolpyruvyl-6-hydroxy-3-cyclohexene-1-carboxylate synthase [Rhodothermus marinus SG0.5JP17-172]|uniref:2-succinyl-5-enolpyruvyl-6-hydroxy-3- cyclohexene-1-carboxylic-acid synthase n=1 Tax=Rhodothermus marinus TaxID=29549 RepID=UPI000223DAB3|nr:2-succinyl-5-enolpyruvyl-6-hydroxy-3-cyclohexene-1-carboxylic-acid synthase [Rhodothermus marinus]AEN72517.1 2-succinyl-5-enolpyruvyl-6-hydroxy-3-cyclohexene-1-carboxylate synthase [Rhodothermus marinus SG0.5JP17-172]MBO2492150.1 2-succinyl-5-enolpyruvyl-6-hydroxy-3-cyclohexene-1-carboxylic-acid synthase [Rhodothermus marinus]